MFTISLGRFFGIITTLQPINIFNINWERNSLILSSKSKNFTIKFKIFYNCFNSIGCKGSHSDLFTILLKKKIENNFEKFIELNFNKTTLSMSKWTEFSKDFTTDESELFVSLFIKNFVQHRSIKFIFNQAENKI